MRIFVTGGNGFVGSNVVRRLIQKGCLVRCLLRSTSDTSRIDDLPVERVFGDVRDAQAVLDGMKSCQAVIHLAGPAGWNEIEAPNMHDIVVGGTGNIISAARECGSLPLVYVSSIVTLGGAAEARILDETSNRTESRSRLTYADAKRVAEAECLAAAGDGLPAVVTNLAEVYGPNDTELVTAGNLIDFATSRPVLVCRGGTSVIHVEDAAEGIIRALERGRSGQRYILGGDNVTIHELARLTLAARGLKGPIVTVPNAIIRTVARLGVVLRLPLPFNPQVVPYATRYWFVDSSKARQDLGVQFRSAAETIGSTMTWLTQAGHVAPTDPSMEPSLSCRPVDNCVNHTFAS